MSKIGKLAMASLKVFRKDLEDSFTELVDEFGLNNKFCKDGESLNQLIEEKREKLIKKVNVFCDKLQNEIKESDEDSSEFKNGNSHNKVLEDLTLSIKELSHQMKQMQDEIQELKNK